MSGIEFQELIGEVIVTVNETEQTAQKQHTPLWDEDEADKFLDLINNFKLEMSEQSGKIEAITVRLERFSWFRVDEDEIDILNDISDLISRCKSLKNTLIKRYVSYSKIRSSGIVKEEIRRYKNAIDNFEEVYDDLEFRFIRSLKDEEFCDITDQLNSL